jgi:signal transduction histidine kinase
VLQDTIRGSIINRVAPSTRRWLGAALASTALVVAVTEVIALLEPRVPALGLGMLYLLAVVPIALLYGGAVAAAVSVASMAAFTFFFLPPRHSFDPGTSERWAVLVAFLVSSLVVGQLAARSQREARRSARLADEQSALRRVATLVAHGTPPEELFAAVTEEVGQLLPVGSAAMGRYDADGMFTTVAAWSTEPVAFPVGRRWFPEGKNVMTLVFQTGRPARIDDFADASGPVGVTAREAGYRSAIGTPIVVEGRLWGVMTAASNAEQPLPLDTEPRLASFTELVATAIANAESRADLAASRARIVVAADEARRRIERDLHDGIQQRVVSLMLELRAAAEDTEPSEEGELRAQLARAVQRLTEMLEELREISRGIHPAILSEGGLERALRVLARRSAVRVELDLHAGQRLPEPVEVAAYYAVSEALTNATKHAHASVVRVALDTRGAIVQFAIRDDGIGGADPGRGSGLVGLSDRIEALGGTLEVTSPVGSGTTLLIEMPLERHSSAPSPQP